MPHADSPPIDVSILVATLNAARTLARCIASVAAQRGVTCELLIGDGDSTDATVDICRAHRAHMAHFHSHADDGIYGAWNQLLPHARGQWLAFLGADDWLPASDTVARLVAAAEHRPAGCRLVYGRVDYFDAAGRCVYREGRPWGDCAAAMRSRNSIPHIGMLHERSIFVDGARFDTRYRIAGDYDLVRRETFVRGAHFAAGVVAAHAAWGGLSTGVEQHWRCVQEVGQIIRRQDGRLPPLDWHLRCGHALARRAAYAACGSGAVALYDRLKSLVLRRRAAISAAR